MKYKNKIKSTHNYLLINLIDDESLERLNKIFGTHYNRKAIKNKIRITRKENSFDSLDKIMRKGSRNRI